MFTKVNQDLEVGRLKQELQESAQRINLDPAWIEQKLQESVQERNAILWKLAIFVSCLPKDHPLIEQMDRCLEQLYWVEGREEACRWLRANIMK